MGVQRSGTTALFESLATDPRVRAVNESAANEAFVEWRLRPAAEIAALASSAPGPLLLKAISETRFRSVADVFADLAACDVRALWIYRDPVEVFASMVRLGWVPADERHAQGVADFWCESQGRLLSSLGGCAGRLAVVRHEEISMSPAIFASAAEFLGVEARSRLRSVASQGRAALPAALVPLIDARTAADLARLDDVRTWRA